MDLAYPLVGLIAWLIAGSTKFLINSVKAGEPAFGLVGYGGMPSNHTSIVTSAAVLIALREGLDHPALGAAVALVLIVVIDARSLRTQVGRHAAQINRLSESVARQTNDGTEDEAFAVLRERMGHTRAEVTGGLVTGALVALAVDVVFDWIG